MDYVWCTYNLSYRLTPNASFTDEKRCFYYKPPLPDNWYDLLYYIVKNEIARDYIDDITDDGIDEIKIWNVQKVSKYRTEWDEPLPVKSTFINDLK